MDTDRTSLRDEELLRLSIERPSVFAVLVERYQAPFLRKAHRVLRNREDAEDVVQEAFTKIYMNAARFEPQEGASFGSWGYKILLNTCFTFHQKRKRISGKRVYFEDEVLYNLSDKTDEGKSAELGDLVATLLSHLPKNLARVLHLHFIMGFKQQEIADMEGETVGAIKTRVFRAKQELKRIYAMQNGE
jgi:RNA polymerase sigma-70 factor (ECF subfamily)